MSTRFPLKRLVAFAPAAVALLVLGGCGTPTGTGSMPMVNCSDPGLSQSDWMAHCSPANPVSSTSQPAAVAPLRFAEAYTGQHGTVTMSKPKTYHPSESAAMNADDKRAVIVSVTVANTSNEVLHGYDWTTAVTADGSSGDEVFDSGSSSGPTDPPDILAGKTGTWKIALGLPASGPADVVVSLSWGLSEPIYWEGQA